MKMVTEIPIPAHICTELRMLHRISSVAFGVPERISYKFICISYNYYSMKQANMIYPFRPFNARLSIHYDHIHLLQDNAMII